jgi:hypothetical protein
VAVPDRIIVEYVAGLDRLEAVLKGLADAGLDVARAEGKWTIREIIHHVVDAEVIWSVGLKAALGNSGCTFDISWYPPDNAWAGTMEYARLPVANAIEFLRATRNHTAQLVKHMPDDAWERHLVFVAPGLDENLKCTVGWIIDWQTRHLDLHVEQIRETRQVHSL